MANLTAGFTALILTEPSGATWDTIPNGTWFLGVTLDSTGPLLNSASANINLTLSSFTVYAAAAPRLILPGDILTLQAVFSDGTSASASLAIPQSVPAPASAPAPAPAPTPTVSYTTHFPISEVPLSENGKWVQHDPNQTYVKVENIGGVQVAHGTMTGTAPCPGICNDSMAHMASGFSQNQTVKATIWKAPSPSPNTEVEIQLSWNDQNPQQNKYWGPTTSTGYEINVHYNGNYLCIGHFKEQNALMCVYNQFVPQTGDIFKAQLAVQSDQTTWIYVWWNGVLQMSVHDFSPPPAGQPGIGFYMDSSARNDVFGFTSVTLTSP